MNTWQREALYHAKTEYPKESCGLVIEKNGNTYTVRKVFK